MGVSSVFSGVSFFSFLSRSLSCLTKKKLYVVISYYCEYNDRFCVIYTDGRHLSLSCRSFSRKLSEQRGVAVIVIPRGIRAAVDRVSSSLQVCADLGKPNTLATCLCAKFLQQIHFIFAFPRATIYIDPSESISIALDPSLHLEHSRVFRFDHFKRRLNRSIDRKRRKFS